MNTEPQLHPYEQEMRDAMAAGTVTVGEVAEHYDCSRQQAARILAKRQTAGMFGYSTQGA